MSNTPKSKKWQKQQNQLFINEIENMDIKKRRAYIFNNIFKGKNIQESMIFVNPGYKGIGFMPYTKKVQ